MEHAQRVVKPVFQLVAEVRPKAADRVEQRLVRLRMELLRHRLARVSELLVGPCLRRRFGDGDELLQARADRSQNDEDFSKGPITLSRQPVDPVRHALDSVGDHLHPLGNSR